MVRLFRAAFATGCEGLQRQRGHLITFAPVFFASGIGLYFGLSCEPALPVFAAALLVALGLAAVSRPLRHTFGPLFAGLACLALGFCAAGLRAHMAGGPIVEFRYYGAIEGRVVAMDRSSNDAIRLTLDQVRLERLAPAETPRRVRVALYGQEGLPLPVPGSHAMLTGHLSAPPSPAEPRGFDFERHAWFLHLGAVGYTRSPVLTFAPPEAGLALAIFRARMALSAAIQERMDGEAGAVAAAVTVGDRSAMPRAVTDALRQSNLAHLLAISGLHMGLVTGFVFGLVRFSFALYPPLAMRWPTRKIAAGAALAAGVAYLGLSGGAVASERAFIMAAMVFGAVLAGRRALTLRAVALAALIVLALQPEALLRPGFQMSFAATTALILVFRWISDRETFGMPGWLRPPFAVLVSSVVAGAATAPIAAAHFNIVSHYGLIANLASVPVMGAVVMPAAVLAAPLSLIGLEAAPLLVMEQGLRWILGVAHWVSGLDGAVGRLPAPPPVVLPLLAVGALGFALWRGGGRWAGAAACVVACALWLASERPSLLISPTGRLVGLMEEDGRALSRARGERFVAESWLENDGDGASQEEAHARGDGAFRLGTQAFVHFTGAKARSATCADAVILVLGDTPDAPLPCHAITPASLRETGALAFSLKQDALLQTTARQVTGRRLWNDAAARQHRIKGTVRRFANGQKRSVATLMGTWISN